MKIITEQTCLQYLFNCQSKFWYIGEVSVVKHNQKVLMLVTMLFVIKSEEVLLLSLSTLFIIVYKHIYLLLKKDLCCLAPRPVKKGEKKEVKRLTCVTWSVTTWYGTLEHPSHSPPPPPLPLSLSLSVFLCLCFVFFFFFFNNTQY